jgi:murein L,D-transpeptidase YcbB/YkuD
MASNGKYTQPAGEKNALGLLKFETTSNENIYLHDTNERHLFEKNIRAYSSGCIRVQEFKKIAEWITEDNDQHYDSEMKKPTHIRKLEESVPVYITYTLINYNYNRPVYSQDIYKLYN